MTTLWEARGTYDDLGGPDVLSDAVRLALAHVPREHLRQLDAVAVTDEDPKGRSLGLYVRDHRGVQIELYLVPHVADTRLITDTAVRLWALRLHLAHTLFHEVGHHVTLTLNRRAEPTRRRADVARALEKWAEQYVAKRMQKFCDALTAPGGAAEHESDALSRAIAVINVLAPPLS
jgi:hypothetical protein